MSEEKSLEDELFDIYEKDNTIIGSLKEIYEKGRADATDEHFQKIMSFISTNNRGNCDYFIVDQIENYISEQLQKGTD